MGKKPHSNTHVHIQIRVGSAGLFLEVVDTRSATGCFYKGRAHTPVQSHSAERKSLRSVSLCMSTVQLKHPSMKRRRVFLPLPLLPTITETLEDAPVLPASTHAASTHAASTHAAQIPESLDEYMTSIQALARPAEAQSGGLVRLQRSPKPRQFSKVQVKLSASLPRGSSRTLRTSRQYGLSPNSTEDFSLKVGREKDCRFKDPVDWLFGQVRT